MLSILDSQGALCIAICNIAVKLLNSLVQLSYVSLHTSSSMFLMYIIISTRMSHFVMFYCASESGTE